MASYQALRIGEPSDLCSRRLVIDTSECAAISRQFEIPIVASKV
jgi:hypothetical protein